MLPPTRLEVASPQARFAPVTLSLAVTLGYEPSSLISLRSGWAINSGLEFLATGSKQSNSSATTCGDSRMRHRAQTPDQRQAHPSAARGFLGPAVQPDSHPVRPVIEFYPAEVKPAHAQQTRLPTQVFAEPRHHLAIPLSEPDSRE